MAAAARADEQDFPRPLHTVRARPAVFQQSPERLLLIEHRILIHTCPVSDVLSCKLPQAVQIHQDHLHVRRYQRRDLASERCRDLRARPLRRDADIESARLHERRKDKTACIFIIHHIDQDPFFPAQSPDLRVRLPVVRRGNDKSHPRQIPRFKRPPYDTNVIFPGRQCQLLCDPGRCYCQICLIWQQLLQFVERNPSAAHDQSLLSLNIHKKWKIRRHSQILLVFTPAPVRHTPGISVP